MKEKIELRFPCEECFTNSWEPTGKTDPNAIRLADGSGYARCAYCSLVKRLSALRERLEKLSEEWRKEAANADDKARQTNSVHIRAVLDSRRDTLYSCAATLDAAIAGKE